MAKSKIDRIAEIAKTKVSYSANGKYNYAPIDYFCSVVFGGKNGVQITQRDFSYFYKYLHRITDAKTYFIYEFKNFDIYVRCGSILYVMQRAFPEISKETLKEWILENTEDHHYLCETWW